MADTRSVPADREAECIAVVLTALPVEFAAVRAHLTNVEESTHKGTVYDVGTFADAARRWMVVVVQIGAGNEQAAVEAERALSHFAPDVAFFVGVAGGVKDVQIGDVVVGQKVYGYERGADREMGFEPRPEVGQSSYGLVRRAEAEARKPDWRRRLGNEEPEHDPTVHSGAIAAGGKVVKSKQTAVATFLRASYGDTLAVEMEGIGFLTATRANEPVRALVVRGISDLLDGKQHADAGGSQKLAARHASAFAFEVLAKLTDDAVRGISRSRPPPVPPIFQAAPYPSGFVQRPEIVQPLAQRLVAPSGQGGFELLVLQGMAGSGKTAIASALAHSTEVWARFPDGVLWTTLGETPEPRRVLDDWLTELGTDHAVTLSDDAAHSSRRRLLSGRAVLLVVDDVFDADHARLLLAGGPRCRALATTRSADTFDAGPAAVPFEVGMLAPDQSIAVLSAWLGRPIPEVERGEALRVADDVGHLPLALHLAAARVARGLLARAARRSLRGGPSARGAGLAEAASWPGSQARSVVEPECRVAEGA
jgi:nucleoside phosphorylase